MEITLVIYNKTCCTLNKRSGKMLIWPARELPEVLEPPSEVQHCSTTCPWDSRHIRMYGAIILTIYAA